MKSLFIAIFLTVGISAQAQFEEVEQADQQVRTVTLLPGESVIAYDYSSQLDTRYVCSYRSRGPQNPRGPRQSDPRFYLSLSDLDLFTAALHGIGFCKISKGNSNSVCEYYVKLSGQGYPNGTGCTRNQFSSYNQGPKKNAILTIRFMLRQGLCL